MRFTHSAPRRLWCFRTAFRFSWATILALGAIVALSFANPTAAGQPRPISRKEPTRAREAGDPTGHQSAPQPATESKKPPAPAEPPVFRARDLSPLEQQVSAEEAQEFADHLFEVIYEDLEEDFILPSRFSELVFDGIAIANPKKDRLVKEFPQAGLKELTATLRRVVEEGADYELQRIYRHDGRRYVRFRLINDDGGLNYHEYRLAHFAEGIYAEDVDVMIAGESQAQTFHHLALGLIQERQLGPYRWLFGPKPGDSSLDKLGEMARAQRTDPAKVIEIYDSLPKPMQLEKLPMLQRIVAAAHLEDEKLYLEALSAMRKQFPKDPSGMLTSIDTLALLGKFEDCNKAVDELDAYVGGDPYLDLKRAAIAMRLGNRSQAKSLSLKVVEAMPAVVPVHWEAMGIVLEIEDYEQALELLKRIDERLSMEWSDLSQIEVYRGFVQSPQYEEWLKYRREQDRKKARARGVETI